MTAQELKETGQRLFKYGLFAEAIPMLKSAAEALPKDEALWQELVMAARDNGQHEQAVEFAKLGIRHHARSDWLWRTLGGELVAIDRLDEAEKALNNSQNLNPNSEWLWRHTANLHRKRKNSEAEAKALEKLAALGQTTPSDHNTIGIQYWLRNDFEKALHHYRIAFAGSKDLNFLFNMALVYKHPEVSQDADAADVYRRILSANSNYTDAISPLEGVKSKLAELAQKVRPLAASLLRREERFQFYLSPFEVFQFDKMEANGLDVKAIQRAKKRLFHEIALNDGKVNWLDDYSLDKSRALALEDELLDESKRRYHWAVFQNKRLLHFLTRGEIEHFLYSDDYFPLDTLRLLNDEPGFRSFMSKPFAKQYNCVLTRAIERRSLEAVEALFDGRRWVDSKDDDACFEGANKRLTDLVGLMRRSVEHWGKHKPAPGVLDVFLYDELFVEMFNLLPSAFATVQRELVFEIRSLAIACYNEHGDAELSKSVLNTCERFKFRSVELNKRLEEDFKAIEQKLQDERKAEVDMWFGENKKPFNLTKRGIKFGETFFPAATVASMRWGITVTGYSGDERYDYLFDVANDLGEHIGHDWTVSKQDEARQTEFFTSIASGCLYYLADAVIEKIQRRFKDGGSVSIGACVLTKQGIAFETPGFFFAKKRFMPWAEVSTETRGGQVIVSSKSQRGVTTSLSMPDTENAVLLPFLRSVMEKQHA